MNYEVNFDSTTPLMQVTEAVSVLYSIPRELVYAGAEDQLGNHPGPDPVVVVFAPEDPDNEFGCCLQAGDAFGQIAAWISELDLATTLCKQLQAHALIDDGSHAAQVWMLVTADGWHGRVVVNDEALDEGALRIEYAYQPIPSRPDIDVQAPPTWQAGWYPNGDIPA